MNQFERFVDQNGGIKDPPKFSVISDLKEIASWLENKFGPGINVKLIPGWNTDDGQQMNFRISVPKIQFESVLFRTYIKPRGYPISLDLIGEDLIYCKNQESLFDNIHKFFNRSDIMLQMQMIKEAQNDRMD